MNIRGIPPFLVAIVSALPAFAEVDFTGEWAPAYHEDAPERIPGPEIGDYMGLPLNDAGRMRADSYDADRISVVTEYECRPHGADYSMRGLSNVRIDNVFDPDTQRLVAIRTRHRFVTAADLGALLPAGLEQTFTTADIARLAGIPRWLAQKMAYCLRRIGAISVAGKRGNAVLYATTATGHAAA